MNLPAAALMVSLTAFSVTAFAQANNFQLVGKGGKVVGKASYTVDKQKDGQRVRTKFEYKLGGAPIATDNPDPDKQAAGFITEAQISGEYKVDISGNFAGGFLQNSGTQVMTSFTPSKPRDVVTVGQIQGGVNLGSKTLPMQKPDFSMAPDYDPAAIQALITSVITHPHSDHLYLLLIPGIGAGPKGNNTTAYVAVADATDGAGTLDGKPVTLKHFALTFNKSKGDLWTDVDGSLMQANIGPLSAKYIRNKFVLTEEPAK